MVTRGVHEWHGEGMVVNEEKIVEIQGNGERIVVMRVL